MSEHLTTHQVIRSTWSVIGAWVAWVVLAIVLVDVLLTGALRRDLPVVVGSVYLGVALWALMWRPALIVDDAGLRLRNVVRDVWVPWGAVAEIVAPLTLTVIIVDGRRFRSFAISSNNRPPRRGLAGTASGARTGQPARFDLPAEPHLGFAQRVASELMAEAAARSAPGPEADRTVRVWWVWESIVPLIAGALAVLVVVWAG